MEVVDGCLVEQDRIVPYHLKFGAGSGETGSSETFSVQEVGLLTPAPTRTGALYPGQVGYIIAGGLIWTSLGRGGCRVRLLLVAERRLYLAVEVLEGGCLLVWALMCASRRSLGAGGVDFGFCFVLVAS